MMKTIFYAGLLRPGSLAPISAAPWLADLGAVLHTLQRRVSTPSISEAAT